MSPPTRRTPGVTGSRGTATSDHQTADEAKADSATDRRQEPADAQDTLALFGASVTRNAYGRTTTFTIPEQDYRRGPAVRRTTGPQDASAPHYWVAEAERIVLAIVARGGTVTSDDLRERYAHEPSATGAAIGALFKRMANKGLLQLVGHRPSTRPEARGRVVGTWTRGSS